MPLYFLPRQSKTCFTSPVGLGTPGRTVSFGAVETLQI